MPGFRRPADLRIEAHRRAAEVRSVLRRRQMTRDLADAAVAKPPQLPCNRSSRRTGGVMGIDRTVAGNPGARKAANDNDQLSAFRRPNDELTFRDFLVGKAEGSSQQFTLGLMPYL
jgi:hypothetical protein